MAEFAISLHDGARTLCAGFVQRVFNKFIGSGEPYPARSRDSFSPYYYFTSL